MTTNLDDVHVRVNGKDIELNSFVKAVVGSTLLGMVSSLRLETTPESIEVQVRVHPDRDSAKK